MDLQYHHTYPIHLVRCCNNSDATNLIAIAGAHSLDVLLLTNTGKFETLASFHIGTRVTALAWSPLSISPSFSELWHIEHVSLFPAFPNLINLRLIVAGENFSLHLLTKSSSEDEAVFLFGGGLSGHHRKINDMTFCGGRQDKARYVATVSDDKLLIVWDLHPSNNMPPRSTYSGYIGTPLVADRLRPTAYVIEFSHPLVAICSHPSRSKDLLVSDCFGSIFLTDWCSEPQVTQSQKPSSHLELVEPSAFSTNCTGQATTEFGSIGWRRDAAEIVGAAYGSRFLIWNINDIQGGKPYASGLSFPEGGHKFKWCPTHPGYFAISTRWPSQGAAVYVHNANYLQAQPIVLHVLPRPHVIQDLDFLAIDGTLQIAVAVEKALFVNCIGAES